MDVITKRFQSGGLKNVCLAAEKLKKALVQLLVEDKGGNSGSYIWYDE